jgi:nucleoside-diphosphate-sugar epimerase
VRSLGTRVAKHEPTSLCLVTGGAGFIGSHIVEALVEQGDEVVVLDDFSLGTDANLAAVEERIQKVRGDVRDRELVRSAMKGVNYVFHQAAASSSLMFKKDPSNAVNVNIGGLLNILTAALEARVKRVVFASTSTVYGNNSMPLREDLMPMPGNLYAASKLAGEFLATAFGKEYGLETVTLRYMSIYGPNELGKGTFANVLTQFLMTMRERKRPVIYGDGNQARDFTYVKDVVQANLLASKYPHKLLGEVFNVGAGEMTTFNRLVEILNKVLGTDIRPEYAPVPIVGYQYHQLADIARINQRLGYKPAYDLERGIRDLLASWEALSTPT